MYQDIYSGLAKWFKVDNIILGPQNGGILSQPTGTGDHFAGFWIIMQEPTTREAKLGKIQN